MRAEFEKCKNMTILDQQITIKSSLKKDQLAQIDALADQLAQTIPAAAKKQMEPAEIKEEAAKVDPAAMFKLSYGLFVLTAKDGGKDNGCIINTVMQVTDATKRIAIAVNKANYTHDMIKKTGVFNISVLNTDAPFKLFKQFGFQSGRDADKFAEGGAEVRTVNGLRYVAEYSNAVISGKVINEVEFDTHTMFIAEVTEAAVLSNVPSVTYQYYFDHIKPQPQPTTEKSGYVCKICGYIYEGDELPADYICPLCKHGVEDFEKL